MNTPISYLEDFIHWLKTLDPKEIVYALLAVIATAVMAFWRGLSRKLMAYFRLRRGLRLYRKALRTTCSSLTVIGRRQGFSMQDVYVPLDLAASDLTQEKPSFGHSELQKPCVIVAGPGAGKSTIVKHKILEWLERNDQIPFLVKLREYSPDRSIEEHLVSELKALNIPEPKITVSQALAHPDCCCVLDGLDEVRPHQADEVCTRINHFYQQYFSEQRGGLIVTCRKEAYRGLQLDIPVVFEVRPLTDQQIRRFADKWPLPYPVGKGASTFVADLFATPRIHELARSPLLLVGGLMQYTESNLGIPDERVQYLARVAQWLVSDWAVAQGHHSDKYRTVYPRLLSRLAFHMHWRELAELSVTEAVKMIGEWLPEYGVDANDAADVLSSVRKKTGIMVSDIPDQIVFSQFGLQEYYASVDLLERVDHDQLLQLANARWWREALLLAIAQRNEPSTYLQALFAVNPLLAAAAVAECSTPSLELQEKAVDACLHAIDRQEQPSRGATVQLLRKVRNVQEERLIKALEERLSNEATAKTAGVVLAIAGTAAATNALARHPSIWQTCMQEAGYLSTSLENLLLSWIQNGDETQTRHATSLLVGRLSADRRHQLLGLLPKLPEAKADLVARMLLEDMADRSARASDGSSLGIPGISVCAARLQNPSDWLRAHIKDFQRFRLGEPYELVLAALASRIAGKTDAATIAGSVVNSAAWAAAGTELFLLLASAFAAAAYVPGRLSVIPDFLCLMMVALVSGGQTWQMYRPGYPMFLVRRSRVSRTLAMALISFGAIVLIAAMGEPVSRANYGIFWKGMSLSFGCALVAFATRLSEPSYFPRADLGRTCGLLRVARVVASGWLVLTAVSTFVYASNGGLPTIPLRFLAWVVLCFFGIVIYALHRDHSFLRNASNAVANTEDLV